MLTLEQVLRTTGIFSNEDIERFVSCKKNHDEIILQQLTDTYDEVSRRTISIVKPLFGLPDPCEMVFLWQNQQVLITVGDEDFYALPYEAREWLESIPLIPFTRNKMIKEMKELERKCEPMNIKPEELYLVSLCLPVETEEF